jgi:methylmalonyl-CoA mutase C-terminal domain/subunit
MSDRKIRVMIAKPGLDGHDRGAKYVSRALRDAGYEVIYTGIRQTPEAIVSAAIQEDVDFLGLSLLSGAHNELFPKIVKLLREKGADDIIIFGGGVIPEADIPFLNESGVEIVFTPGTPIKDVISFIEENKQRLPVK